MIRDPKDLKRYTASERVNHWIIGMCFILLALSGLAFFHPAFWKSAEFLTFAIQSLFSIFREMKSPVEYPATHPLNSTK